MKRFAKEIRILSSLDHHNIIRIVGKRLAQEPYFAIMPLYKRSLRSEIPSLIGDEDRIGEIFGALLDAIEYAHEQGIIHRDLKPENVLMNSDADVVVTDFGLGRIVDAESTRMTQTGWQLGTPMYMPPEQLQDAKNADARSDIFSLGRLLYELYTGPLLSAVQDTSSLPPGIALIVNRCTRVDPAERFESATDLKNAWQSLFDAYFRQSELDEFLALRAEFGAPGPYEADSMERFLELLSKYQEDPDLLHETVMQLNPSAVVAMHEANQEFTRVLIFRFAELAAAQSWGFSYTDKIGDKCKAIFIAVTDPDIRAALILCAMQVGESHNRWHVLGTFAEMLQDPKGPGEEYAVADALEGVKDHVREHAAQYVALPKLHPRLRRYFDFSSE